MHGATTKTFGDRGTRFLRFLKEPLNKSAAALSGSFAPTYRFENLEILRSRWRLCRLTDAACPLRVHKVHLHFSNLVSTKNLSPNALAELCGAAPDSRLNCAVLPLTRTCACCMVRCCPWHIFGGRRRVLRFFAQSEQAHHADGTCKDCAAARSLSARRIRH